MRWYLSCCDPQLGDEIVTLNAIGYRLVGFLVGIGYKNERKSFKKKIEWKSIESHVLEAYFRVSCLFYDHYPLLREFVSFRVQHSVQ